MKGRNDYPEDWKAIANTIKDYFANWHCENCGHPHDPETSHTLTVHHLDGDKANCAPWNLVALCQRCHLSIQAIYHVGQMTLPGLFRPWIERTQRSILNLWKDIEVTQ
jgi:5-methylcytosine-specific restriction endonuclease McrA